MIANPASARTDAVSLPHPSVAALRTVGLLGRSELPAGDPQDLSRAHGVWAVHLPDGRQVVVKSGAFAGDADDREVRASLGAELFVHRMAHWVPALREALPAPAVVDEEHGILVVEDIGEGRPASLALVADAVGDVPAFFRLLGARVGAVHRATAGLPLPDASPPLVLQVLCARAPRDGAEPDVSGLAEATRGIVAGLRARPGLVAAARRLRAPAGRSLVHHDLKWDNIAVAPGPAPVIVDWELAGAGDPAWDLGCLVAEHLLREESVHADLPSPCRALVRGYGAAARISPRAADLFAERAALAAILRLAQFALEVAERGTDGDADRAAALAALAAARWERASELTGGLRSCLAR